GPILERRAENHRVAQLVAVHPTEVEHLAAHAALREAGVQARAQRLLDRQRMTEDGAVADQYGARVVGPVARGVTELMLAQQRVEPEHRRHGQRVQALAALEEPRQTPPRA